MRNGPIINGGKAFAPSSYSVGGTGLPWDTLGQSVRALRAQVLGLALLLQGLVGIGCHCTSSAFPGFSGSAMRSDRRQKISAGDHTLGEQIHSVLS